MKQILCFMLALLFFVVLPVSAGEVMVSDAANAWTTTEYYPASGYTNTREYDRFQFTVTADSLADSAYAYVEVSDDGSTFWQATASEKILAEQGSTGGFSGTDADAGYLDFTINGNYDYVRLVIIGATSGDTFNVFGLADRQQKYNAKNY